MSKIALLLAFGGESEEHDVSVDSAKYMSGLLDRKKYDVFFCYVDRNGRWCHIDDINNISNMKSESELIPRLGKTELIRQDGWSIKPDILLPVMLGPNGEDGSVQGLAQLLHVPVVGCGVLGSAICMDKEVSKRLLLNAKIHVADYIVHRKGQSIPNYRKIVEHLGENFFIKPAGLGSSIGIKKINTEEEYLSGLDAAHKHDDKVLLEKFVDGIEVGCGIIGNASPKTSVVSRIKLGSNDFFTYHAKYSAQSTASMIIPADIPENITDRIRDTAVRAYRTLECSGFARVDMFLSPDERIFVNEINTLPAFRSDSSYPKLWKASGLSPDKLLDKIIYYSMHGK